MSALVIKKKKKFQHAEKAGSEPKTRHNYVVVAKTLDKPQAEDKLTSLKFIERCVEEGEKTGPALGMIQQVGHSSRSLNARSYEQLGCCADVIEANIELARERAWNLHKNI